MYSKVNDFNIKGEGDFCASEETYTCNKVELAHIRSHLISYDKDI